MVLRRTLPAAAAALLGCGSAETSVPRAWRPLRLGAAAGGAPACPPIRGTYGVDSELLFSTLIGQRMPAESRKIVWIAFTLHGEPDSALIAIVLNARNGADTMRLQRDEAYRCVDGWLQPTFPTEGLASDGAVETTRASPALRRTERAVFVAGAKDGALVARLVTTTYDDVPLKCGDGCTSVRVPFSGKTTVRWERQAAFDLKVTEIDPDDTRLRLDPRDTRARRVIRAALPPDVELRGVSPRADGWHVSIALRDKSTLVALLATLNSTPGLADARVERAHESLNLEGSWHEVLWLRFTSR